MATDDINEFLSEDLYCMVEQIRTIDKCQLIGNMGHIKDESGIMKQIKAKIIKEYNLPCEYVIHTIEPIWNRGRSKEEEFLASCYFNSMKLAMDNEIRTIAFTSISTGVYSFMVKTGR